MHRYRAEHQSARREIQKTSRPAEVIIHCEKERATTFSLPKELDETGCNENSSFPKAVRITDILPSSKWQLLKTSIEAEMYKLKPVLSLFSHSGGL